MYRHRECVFRLDEPQKSYDNYPRMQTLKEGYARDLLNFFVFFRDVFLVHDGEFNVCIEFSQVEVGTEGQRYVSLRIPLNGKGFWLVLPFNLIHIEYACKFSFGGIFENGHIAFNDPPVADFNDPKPVKVVELEIACRQQQVNEKLFENINLVPTHAITITIPALMKADYMFCVVPAKNKAEAVYRTLNDEISEACPATILRTKQGAILYLDGDSASLLNNNISLLSGYKSKRVN